MVIIISYDNVFEFSDKVYKSALDMIDVINASNTYEMDLVFNVEIEPYHRPRTSSLGHFYVPNASKLKKQYSKLIDEMLDDSYELIPAYTEIIIEKCIFYIQTPKSFSKKDKLLAEWGILKPVSRPDLDNYIKTFLDVLTDKIYTDDSNITTFKLIEKRYSVNPRTEVTISWKNDAFSKYNKNK